MVPIALSVSALKVRIIVIPKEFENDNLSP